jgi:hypothetical protein
VNSTLSGCRSGGPPVWLAGGDTTKVIEWVAAGYDGWLPYLPDANAYARACDRIRAQAGYVQAIRGGSVQECLDWLGRYVDAGARHVILRIGSLTARPNPLSKYYFRH